VSDGDQSEVCIGCGWCETHIDGFCPECARSRRRAVHLRDQQGLRLAEIAERMATSQHRATRLLEQADQALDLERFKLDTIPTAALQQLFERRRIEDPTITEASVARAAKMQRIDLRRALGRSPAKGSDCAQEHVTVAVASRIVKALGVAPHEIDGL
jgi:hypothetical protein